MLVVATLLVCGTARAQSVDPRIAEARADFEREFVKDVRVLQDRYRKALENHLRNFTRSGDLDSAKEAFAELKAAKSWHSIPRVYGESGLRNEQFSGETFLTFDGKEMTYTSKSKPAQYEYSVAGPRTVEVANGGWRLDFSKDLHSGTFQTKDNSYEIEVLFERGGDPLPEGADDR